MDDANLSDNQEVVSNPPWLFGDILDVVVKRELPTLWHELKIHGQHSST